MTEKGSFPKSPIQISDYASRPFQKMALDLFGEIIPCSDRGHRYILSLTDTCTRWVDCLPLKFCTSEAIAECLYSV